MFKIASLTLLLTMLLCADTLTLDTHMANVSTFPNVQFFEDTTKNMGIEEVRKQDFKTEEAFHSNQGISRSNWWLSIGS